MHLVATREGTTLRTKPSASRGTPKDHTAAMTTFIDSCLPGLSDLRGFILMQKSPSCGLKRVRIHDGAGNVKQRDAAGLFAQSLETQFPLMPLEEAGRLHDDRLCENFIERVYFYDDWCRLLATGLTPSGLLDFHSRHKFQFLAHSQKIYRRLGPALANLKAAPLKTIADEYIYKATEAMKQPASSGAYINVMEHLSGYLRDHLDDYEYRMIKQQITRYQAKEVPLVVPMTLIRNAQGRVADPFLAKQDFLSPYPDQLGLRNTL